MPTVGKGKNKRKFPYTPKGKEQAKKARKRKSKK